MVGAVLFLFVGCGEKSNASTMSEGETEYRDTMQIESERESQTENQVEAEQKPEYVEIQNVDWSAYEEVMTAEEYVVLQEYLPVLMNETSFEWVVGMNLEIPHRIVTMEEFQNTLIESYEEPWNLRLDAVKICDLDANGTEELILVFRDFGWFYLILNHDGEMFYGLELGIRWFEGLQSNGVYIGSGGAAWNYYYQMTFEKGIFEATSLGHTEFDNELNCEIYFIGEEQVDEDTFWEWESNIMVGDVPEYKPVAK